MGSVTFLVKRKKHPPFFSQEPANFEIYVSRLIPKLCCRRRFFALFFCLPLRAHRLPGVGRQTFSK